MPYYELLHIKGEDEKLKKLLDSHAKNNAERRYKFITGELNKKKTKTI